VSAGATATRRRYPVGAEVIDQGTSFRVWAPSHDEVRVQIERGGETTTVPLSPEAGGYHSAHVPGVTAGARYRIGLGEETWPDPASRWQPEGPHGPSCVVDPSAFRWTDGGWTGLPRDQHVLYELHVGTFTPEGTWSAAAARLQDLAEIGITTVEMMPVSEFAGAFGWGYDGVAFFAPYHHYGSPDDLRAFVDRAHALGMAVILDVVFNHYGPDGCYVSKFSRDYESTRHKTDWGCPPNYDGEGSGPVREFFVANAAYWIDEYHFDGLRLDATQDVKDDSPRHVLADVADAVTRAGGVRRTLIVAENEPQHTVLVRPPSEGGYGIDALWNDDFHHSARVAATGRAEAYYTDYRGTAMEFVAAARFGYLFQGQRYEWQDKLRGTSALDLPASSFVHFIENHDQVANSARGLRLHQQTSPSRWRALTALLLLGPQLPMLFQGQEFSASAPFLFFADHAGELANNVRKGRREFLAQFPSLRSPDAQALIPVPGDPGTRDRCVLDWNERRTNHSAVALHRDLIGLRRKDPVLRGDARARVDGAVLGPHTFAIRLFATPQDSAAGPAASTGAHRDHLLIVNLGPQWSASSVPEPLIAAPSGCEWAQVWCSEAPHYGGSGAPPVCSDGRWRLPAESATLLIAHLLQEGQPA
jgi:maltooligosyltrehalose trehalohydrolase